MELEPTLVTLVLFLTSFLAPLNYGTGDVYMYILYARVSTVHHANPYTIPPAAFGGRGRNCRRCWRRIGLLQWGRRRRRTESIPPSESGIR